MGFADANDPYIRALPEVVTKGHQMPEDFMEKPTVVISYFIPFTEELADGNIGIADYAASESWADAYKITNAMMARLNEYLVEKLQGMGYRAAVPTNAGMHTDILRVTGHRDILHMLQDLELLESTTCLLRKMAAAEDITQS